jgi:ornithine--oxo-acid transaminase
MSDKIALERRHGATNYDPLPIVLDARRGRLALGRRGPPLPRHASAYSAVSFGYGHPKLVAGFSEQARRLAVTSRAFHSDRCRRSSPSSAR